MPIKSNVFLYVFLPTLVFQVTLGLNLRLMADDWVPILVQAVVAVLVATFVVGYSLAFVSTLSLSAALLVGAVVSTTDPSAVVRFVREIRHCRRDRRILAKPADTVSRSTGGRCHYGLDRGTGRDLDHGVLPAV